MSRLFLKNYYPHIGQKAFHYAINKLFRYVAMVCGIRGGKTYAGAREAGQQAWNSPLGPPAAYCIVAPTYNMLDRTTWVEFEIAMRPLILTNNTSKKIIVLRNGKLVYGFSAEDPDRIRNVTASGVWIDEGRECKNFRNLWKVVLGRVLSTDGKIIVTTSPNSYDDIYEIFVEKRAKQYGYVHFPTSQNTFLKPEAVEELRGLYDEKYAQQELDGQFVIFEGAVYYTFNRLQNAGDLAFKVAQYNPNIPLWLACDFNVDPMAWVVMQPGINQETKLREVYCVDEIYLKNSNTFECCAEFKSRYPNHNAGVVLYGDATGKARHTSSNVTNWMIIEDELRRYGIVYKVPNKNPNERDRVNSVNALICNSKKQRRVFVNPQTCHNLIRDFEQVSYKPGSVQIDKGKDLALTHPSDAFGYMADMEFGLGSQKYQILKI